MVPTSGECTRAAMERTFLWQLETALEAGGWAHSPFHPGFGLLNYLFGSACSWLQQVSGFVRADAESWPRPLVFPDTYGWLDLHSISWDLILSCGLWSCRWEVLCLFRIKVQEQVGKTSSSIKAKKEATVKELGGRTGVVWETKGICRCLGKLSYTFASHRKLAEKKQLDSFHHLNSWHIISR